MAGCEKRGRTRQGEDAGRPTLNAQSRTRTGRRPEVGRRSRSLGEGWRSEGEGAGKNGNHRSENSSLGAVDPIKANINLALEGKVNGTGGSSLHQLSALLGGERTR